MGMIAFINEQTLELHSIFNAQAPPTTEAALIEPPTPDNCVRMEIPADIMNLEAMVISRNENGDITLSIDHAKLEIIHRPQWAHLRHFRDELLKNCDWTMTTDSALSVESKAKWQAYRQELRELPSNTTNPSNPPWPNRP